MPGEIRHIFSKRWFLGVPLTERASGVTLVGVADGDHIKETSRSTTIKPGWLANRHTESANVGRLWFLSFIFHFPLSSIHSPCRILHASVLGPAKIFHPPLPKPLIPNYDIIRYIIYHFIA